MNEFYKNKQDIIKWLDKYKIKQYELIADAKYGFVINISQDVDFMGLSFIPVKFNHIEGSLYCSMNSLTSLEFCPETITKNFDCSHNKLTSLEYCPKFIGESFDCSNNQIKSLKGCPKKINDNFNCEENLLTSLEHCPQIIKKDFNCYSNKLVTLEFLPKKVKGKFIGNMNIALPQLDSFPDFSEICKQQQKEKFAKNLDKNLPLNKIKKNSIKL